MADILKVLTPMLAIVAILVLELYALSKGINGTYLTLSFTAVSGLATGGTIAAWQHSRKRKG